MSEAVAETKLTTWYETGARKYLASHAADRIPALDSVFQRLRLVAQTAGRELPVCFLGSSGVGKSTLINALVAGSDSVLPQGGVGPLTAQATIVRHAEHSRFTARYLPRRRLNNLLFALERSLDSQLDSTTSILQEVPGAEGLDEELIEEVEAAQDDPDDPSTGSKIDAYRRQAALLIRGSQFAEVAPEYLCDRIRDAMGLDHRWGIPPDPQDADRVDRIGEVLRLTRENPDFEHVVKLGTDRGAFQRELESHASGFLAPLIRTLDVGWNSDLLRGGLVLVDLPGIGVANDEYRKVTADWIRRARAIVLVVDRAGVTEAGVDLLRTTGFLNGMLHESLGADMDPPLLLVAVVKVDLIASDARLQDKQLNGKAARPWLDHFEEHCEKLRPVIIGQLRDELHKTVAAGAEETADSRREVMDTLLGNLEVHPFSAHEYRLFLEGDEEESPHINKAEQSKIPQFSASLHSVVEARETRLAKELIEVTDEAQEKSTAGIRLILAQWKEQNRAAEGADELRAELEEFVAPLQRELDVRKGQYREFLRETMAALIESKTQLASEQARKSIDGYLSSLKNYHWCTLRAAVRRGGAFVGAKHVDLPNELTLRFEDPVAVVWSNELLAELRRRTREMGEDYVRLVGEVVEWARSQGARVKPDVVQALYENLKADTKDLGRIGKDVLSELKEAVKAELYEGDRKSVV